MLLFLLFLLFFLTWPPVRELCKNHEVVMFQPRTGTSPYLGSFAIVNLISILFLPTCFNYLLDIISPPCTYSYLPPIFHHSIRFHSLCCTRFSPQLVRERRVCPRNEGICTVYYNNLPKLDYIYVCIFVTQGKYNSHTLQILSFMLGTSLHD